MYDDEPEHNEAEETSILNFVLGCTLGAIMVAGTVLFLLALSNFIGRGFY